MNGVESLEPIKKDIEILRNAVEKLDHRMDQRERETLLMQAEIKSTNTRVDNIEKVLSDINENTKWIKRTMTKAGIGAIFSLIVAGAIGLIAFYFKSLGG